MGAYNYTNQLMSCTYTDSNPGAGDYDVVQSKNKTIRKAEKTVIGSEKRF